jgi:hypothetical protein
MERWESWRETARTHRSIVRRRDVIRGVDQFVFGGSLAALGRPDAKMFLPATHMGWAAGYALACRSATDVDASLFPLFRWMGMDVVIRNHNSDYLVACIEL